MDINSETRNKWIKIRVSQAEKLAIENKAELVGCKVADLVRQSLQRVNCWTAIDKEIAREKIREIRRIGENLNQIAHWCNKYKSSAESLQVLIHLVAIEQNLQKLLSSDDQPHKKGLASSVVKELTDAH